MGSLVKIECEDLPCIQPCKNETCYKQTEVIDFKATSVRHMWNGDCPNKIKQAVVCMHRDECGKIQCDHYGIHEHNEDSCHGFGCLYDSEAFCIDASVKDPNNMNGKKLYW